MFNNIVNKNIISFHLITYRKKSRNIMTEQQNRRTEKKKKKELRQAILRC